MYSIKNRGGREEERREEKGGEGLGIVGKDREGQGRVGKGKEGERKGNPSVYFYQPHVNVEIEIPSKNPVVSNYNNNSQFNIKYFKKEKRKGKKRKKEKKRRGSAGSTLRWR